MDKVKDTEKFVNFFEKWGSWWNAKHCPWINRYTLCNTFSFFKLQIFLIRGFDKVFHHSYQKSARINNFNHVFYPSLYPSMHPLKKLNFSCRNVYTEQCVCDHNLTTNICIRQCIRQKSCRKAYNNKHTKKWYRIFGPYDIWWVKYYTIGRKGKLMKSIKKKQGEHLLKIHYWMMKRYRLVYSVIYHRSIIKPKACGKQANMIFK